MNKQIEEMAKVICKTVHGKELKHCDVQCNVDCTGIATALYEQGHVVLTREEYDNLKLGIQKAHNKGVQAAFDMTKFKEESIKRKASKETAEKYQARIDELEAELDMVIKEQKEDRSYEIEQAQKEKAEEIFSKLMEKCGFWYGRFVGVGKNDIIELARQHGIEIEE